MEDIVEGGCLGLLIFGIIFALALTVVIHARRSERLERTSEGVGQKTLSQRKKNK